MTIEYLDLADYVAIAAAGFGDTDFYPDFIDKATLLIVRLARNHPLPDGNKRAAWVALRLFVDINSCTGTPSRPCTTPKQPWWRSPRASGTKHLQPTGSETTSNPDPTPDP
jgi:hypothetical protein